jgi:hypothetical protein
LAVFLPTSKNFLFLSKIGLYDVQENKIIISEKDIKYLVIATIF